MLRGIVLRIPLHLCLARRISLTLCSDRAGDASALRHLNHDAGQVAAANDHFLLAAREAAARWARHPISGNSGTRRRDVHIHGPAKRRLNFRVKLGRRLDRQCVSAVGNLAESPSSRLVGLRPDKLLRRFAHDERQRDGILLFGLKDDGGVR
jgi:hypothetical protein